MGLRGPRASAIVVFGALLTISAPASALPSARLVYLRGAATESCPSESDVRQAVQERLGYDPFSSYAASTMLVEVTAASGGYSANLKLVDGESIVRGDRALRTQGQCTELMTALALTISIAIDPMSVTRTGPPEDLPPSEKAVDPSVVAPTDDPASTAEPAPEPERPTAAPASKEPARLSVALAPLVSVGSAPSIAAGAGLSVDARVGHFFTGLEARADLPASAEAEGLGRVQSSLVAGSLFIGAREGLLFAGVITTAGRWAATSTDVAASRDRDAFYLGTGLRLGLGIPLGERIEARVRADVLANLLRHTLEISGREVYELPVASANLSAGLAVRFW